MKAAFKLVAEDSEDELLILSDSETESLKTSALPIPIPSHKRRPVVKYEEGESNKRAGNSN